MASNFQIKPNTGSLFKNDRKDKDTSPDYKGTVNIDGREMYIRAWLKTSKKGIKFMSLSFTPKQAQGQGRQPERQNNWHAQASEDEVPF